MPCKKRKNWRVETNPKLGPYFRTRDPCGDVYVIAREILMWGKWLHVLNVALLNFCSYFFSPFLFCSYPWDGTGSSDWLIAMPFCDCSPRNQMSVLQSYPHLLWSLIACLCSSHRLWLNQWTSIRYCLRSCLRSRKLKQQLSELNLRLSTTNKIRKERKYHLTVFRSTRCQNAISIITTLINWYNDKLLFELQDVRSSNL